VKLFGFFLYQRTPKAFAYWDLERDFSISASRRCAASGAANNGQMSDKWGYGFPLYSIGRFGKQFIFPINARNSSDFLSIILSSPRSAPPSNIRADFNSRRVGMLTTYRFGLAIKRPKLVFSAVAIAI
jgi:hypothetical protein